MAVFEMLCVSNLNIRPRCIASLVSLTDLNFSNLSNSIIDFSILYIGLHTNNEFLDSRSSVTDPGLPTVS